LGEAVGDGDGDGPEAGTTRTCTVAVAWDVPARATRLKLVVHSGRTWCVPFASTVPIPLSISTLSAPVTSHVSVVAPPAAMSGGAAANFWMLSVLGFVRSWMTPHWATKRASRTRTGYRRRVKDIAGLAERTLPR